MHIVYGAVIQLSWSSVQERRMRNREAASALPSSRERRPSAPRYSPISRRGWDKHGFHRRPICLYMLLYVVLSAHSLPHFVISCHSVLFIATCCPHFPVKIHQGALRHCCDDPVCPDPVWKLSSYARLALGGVCLVLLRHDGRGLHLGLHCRDSSQKQQNSLKEIKHTEQYKNDKQQ